MAATFSVLLLTAPPPGQATEAGGAFVKIDGREVLLRSVELFLNRDSIKQIQLCFLADELAEAKRKYSAHLGFSGVKVISGGPRWIDQIAAAADKISADCSHVIIHDAARPAVPYTDLESLMGTAEKQPAIVLAAPLRTQLVEVDEGGNALALHPAIQYMQLLTPQVYTKAKFEEMARSKQDPHASQLTILKGSPLNVRVGGGGDVSMAKAMLNMLPKPKTKGPLTPFEEAQW